MGWPVCVQDTPYAYGLFTCPIPYGSPICIWEPIRRTGDPYVYGARPFFFIFNKCCWPTIHVWITVSSAVDYTSMFRRCLGGVLVACSSLILVTCNQNLMTVTLTSFPCSKNFKQRLALNLWQKPGVCWRGSKGFRKPFLGLANACLIEIL